MQYPNEKIAELVSVRTVASFLALGSLATFLPFVIHLQWLTGPIVNAVLILALFILGFRPALLLCFIPSMMALLGGLLPAVLAPAVPFIMLSNVIFIALINSIYKSFKNEIAGFGYGVLAGAGAKFIFLTMTVYIITPLLAKKELGIKVAQMMSWPQFATALTGGLIAFAVLKWLKRI
jgi:riboflavin transporter